MTTSFHFTKSGYLRSVSSKNLQKRKGENPQEFLHTDQGDIGRHREGSPTEAEEEARKLGILGRDSRHRHGSVPGASAV